MLEHRKNLMISLSCIWLFALVSAAHADALTVRTKNGTLAGLMMRTRHGRVFVGFRGIPYAAPPLGELRFQPPRPAAAWNGVRSARNDAAICPQRNIFLHQKEIMGNEDCLYLNVYTPKVPSDEEAATFQRFPVMIWFHGGGWLVGAGRSDFFGPKYLMDHDIVLVTVNFRLGPLGFLSTEDMECPGNLGMKDQAQSIRWVHENIVFFGGDPNRVTLFGQSAGGASVHYHMMSPLSQGLFHRGISQSGTGHCPWTLTRPGLAKKKAKILGERLKCPTGSSKELIACLRTKSAVAIIATDHIFQVFDYCPIIPFRPVIEPNHLGAFLTEDPVISTKRGRLSDIPWMTGIMSEEGSLRVASIYGLFEGKLLRRLQNDFKNIAPLSLLYEDTCFQPLRDEVTGKIREFYFGDRDIDESTRFKVIDMYSDAWFTYGAHTAVRDFLETQSSPVYYYYFSYKNNVSFSKIFGDPTKDYGVAHGDDLQYLFPIGEQKLFKNITKSAEDYRMIDIMTSLWFNFANSANPTPRITKTIPVKWKPVKTPYAFEYLHIGNSKLVMVQDLLPTRMKFWDNLPVRIDPETEMH